MNRIAKFYGDRDFIEDWISDCEYEVHGSAFGNTCDNCDLTVPEGYTCCPHCGSSYDDPSSSVDPEDRARDGGAKEGAGWAFAREAAVLIVCWLFLGFLARIWFVGASVEFFRLCEWWNG